MISLRWPIALTMIALVLTAFTFVWSLCLGVGLTDAGKEKVLPFLIVPPCLFSLGLWLAALGSWGRLLWDRLTN